MEYSTTKNSPNEENEEITEENIQKANDSLDTIAYYLLEALNRKFNQQLHKEGA